ncbi:MAG: helix-turn-helix domain-containing protein [Chloroflexi bacterium]|nr:helix-turn-helix domain-containing protein [Chloroflexota bacterium]
MRQQLREDLRGDYSLAREGCQRERLGEFCQYVIIACRGDMTMVMRATGEPVYTVEQVARIFKLTPRAVRELIREGDLPAKRVGRYYRVPKSVIEGFFAQARKTTFTPEDLGFGIWKARRDIRDGATEVNRMRNRNRKSLKETEKIGVVGSR